jgi:hypothetical protein
MSDPSPRPDGPGFDTRGVLRCEDGEGVRLLTFDRPQALNAFNQDLWLALVDGSTTPPPAPTSAAWS